MQNLNEMDCFNRSLAYVAKHLPYGQVVEKCYTERDEQLAFKECKSLATMVSSLYRCKKVSEEEIIEKLFPKTATFDPEKPIISNKDIFPCVLVMCGSAFRAFKVFEDGTFSYIDQSKRAGKLWLGLGSLLTNARSYDELMGLAEEGTNDTLDLTTKDISEMEGASTETSTKLDEENVYSTSAQLDFWQNEESQSIYYFAKAEYHSIGDFKRQDLARGYLNVMVSDVVSFGLNSARHKHLKQVFYTGSFINHPLVKKLMYREWMRTSIQLAAFDEDFNEPIHMHILSHGSHFGALGAMLNHMELYNDTTSNK